MSAWMSVWVSVRRVSAYEAPFIGAGHVAGQIRTLYCDLGWQTSQATRLSRTPARHRSSSDVAKAPLTPSHLLSALNNVSISSPTKTGSGRSSKYSVADITNPFISESRPVSPVKRTTSGTIQILESLQRQASSSHPKRRHRIKAKCRIERLCTTT